MLDRARTLLAPAIALAVLTLVVHARAALGPRVSDDQAGQSWPVFEGETLDGRAFDLGELRGRPVVVDFFASWCAVCQAEHAELRKLHADYSNRGVAFVGVLVDPVETPDTVAEARALLKRSPLPYPVVMMTEAHRSAFRYVGFPSTYLLAPDGKFSTTFYGFQPSDQIAMKLEPWTAARSNAAAAAEPSSAATEPSSSLAAPAPLPAAASARAPWEHAPLRALVPRGVKQWHPAFVHLPIGLLVIEGLLVVVNLVRPRETFARFSRWLLWSAVLTLPLAVYSGLSDAGADLGPGWAFWNGLVDRVHHFLRLESTVSLHVIYALVVVATAVTRLLWRERAKTDPIAGAQRGLFEFITAVGLWALFAAGQVGGSISHP